jgi:hypothetical protein
MVEHNKNSIHGSETYLMTAASSSSSIPLDTRPGPHTTPTTAIDYAGRLSGTSALTPPIPAILIMFLGLPLGLRPRAPFAAHVLQPHRPWSLAG